MKPVVYIDGREGTTGLQIYDRLSRRKDIELLVISQEKRKDTAERIGKPAYTVFTNDTLAQIASQRPADSRSLGRISGIGAHKLGEYGDDVLRMVREG